MAIVINKKKQVEAPSVAPSVIDPLLSEFADKIDNVGRLEKDALKVKDQIKKLQEKLKPYTKAYKELQELVDALPTDADEKVEQLGVEFVLEAGSKGTSREVIDMKKVHEILGDDLFYQCAKITLTDLDKYMIEPQRDLVITKSRTSRGIKLIPRK